MSSQGTGGGLFKHDLYEKSVTDTKTLKESLVAPTRTVWDTS